MSEPLLRWRDDTALGVEWEDRTPHGGPIGARLEHSLRDAFPAGVAALRAGAPLPEVLNALAPALDGSAFAALARRGGEAWVLADEVLWPDPGLTRPAAVTFTGASGRSARAVLPAGLWPGAHALFADLAGPGAPAGGHGRPRDLRALLDGLAAGGFLTDAAPDGSDAPTGPGATFVGHNTVVVSSGRHRVVVDPFLLPASAGHPGGYQPLAPRHLGPLDAVLVTHAHPDHFDPATLLQLPAATPVVVPVVGRESALAPDLARRLGELGFTDVRPRRAGAVERFGDVEVHVAAFPGEQPSDAERLHPEARNAGNVYVVRTPAFSAAFVADAGRDPTGDVRDVASAHRRAHGPVDAVFGGYRGWLTYPPQLLLSSVGRYFAFVPPAAWGSRMQLMNDADGLLDTAERFGARWVVPCAAGGAPWYWGRGLGPRADTGAERPGFDPLPERVVAAAGRRAAGVTGPLASPVRVVVARPGDTLDAGGGVARRAGHAWPWGEPVTIT